jgi:hypothetical protein
VCVAGGLLQHNDGKLLGGIDHVPGWHLAAGGVHLRSAAVSAAGGVLQSVCWDMLGAAGVELRERFVLRGWEHVRDDCVHWRVLQCGGQLLDHAGAMPGHLPGVWDDVLAEPVCERVLQRDDGRVQPFAVLLSVWSGLDGAESGLAGVLAESVPAADGVL